jgi:hypothetical protein
VPVPDPLLAALTATGSCFGVVLAYGPAPGLELIPYFLGLLAWVGLALSAFLLAPIAALIRRLRRTRGAVPPEPGNDPLSGVPAREGEAPAEPALTARQEPRPPDLGQHPLLPSASEPSADARHDKA